MNGFFLWANTILLFSCLVEFLDFTGSLVIFTLGSPFIVIIIHSIKDERKSYLT